MAAGVRAAFGKRLARFELSVDVRFEPGVTALVGPSGSGKTMLIRCLAGLERPERGLIAADEVWFDASARRWLAPQRRRCGFVFNDYALFPHLSVRDNVRFASKHVHRADELMAMLAIGPLGDRFPRQLSAGEQQRVAIARAVVSDPKLLLLDEPFSSVDGHLKARIYDDFLALLQRLEIPVVLVTHDLDEASMLAQQLIVLKAGQVLQTGAPSQVMTEPRTPEVATFAGIRNLFEGRLLSGNRMRWGAHQLDLDVAPGSEGEPVHWFVRAERLELCPPDETGPNRLIGSLRSLAPLMGGYRLIIEIPGGGRLELWAPAAATQRYGLERGASLGVFFPPQALQFFPPAAPTSANRLGSR